MTTSDGSKTSLGTVNNYPMYLDGDLTLVYSKGDVCPNADLRPFFETNIEFNCDPEALSLFSSESSASTHSHSTHNYIGGV
jgi:hypothetical protein